MGGLGAELEQSLPSVTLRVKAKLIQAPFENKLYDVDPEG
jgi:hypothetical protein